MWERHNSPNWKLGNFGNFFQKYYYIVVVKSLLWNELKSEMTCQTPQMGHQTKNWS